jgi:hypothetical protein
LIAVLPVEHQPAVIVPPASSGVDELLLQASGKVTAAIATRSQNIPLRFRRVMISCSTS